MNKGPITEQVLQASIRERAYLPQGSVDEGVQSAPVPVGDDTRLKKIYVYADNVWYPQSATDTRTVIVKTDAFDLTGWVDFTHARGQDQFQTEIRVTMAHASGRAAAARGVPRRRKPCHDAADGGAELHLGKSHRDPNPPGVLVR